MKYGILNWRFAVKILRFVFPVILFLSGPSANANPSPFAQQKPIKVPGTKVSLVPPDGLKPSDQFPGFLDEETSSSIMITELPAPYSEMANGFTKEALGARGMNLFSRKDISLK